MLLYLYFLLYGLHLRLHSFPTRRSSDLHDQLGGGEHLRRRVEQAGAGTFVIAIGDERAGASLLDSADRKSTRLNSSHLGISYAVFCLKKKNAIKTPIMETLHKIKNRKRH